MHGQNSILADLAWSDDEGALSYKGVRYLLIRPDVLMTLYREMERLAPDRAAQVFYDAGLGGGQRSGATFREKLGLDAQGTLEFMARMGREIGWGAFRLRALDVAKKDLRVEIGHSPYAEAYGRSTVPVCHLLRGVLAGIGRVIFDGDVTAEETACAATGASACTFVVRGVS